MEILGMGKHKNVCPLKTEARKLEARAGIEPASTALQAAA